MKLITFISAGAFIFFSAFALKKQAPSSLYETKWTLKSIHTDGTKEEVKTKAFIQFHAEKKSAGGNGSCNSFGSNFTCSGNQISFKNIFSTKMYCEEMQKTEDTFFKQLEKVNRFEIKSKTLLLYQGDVLLLEFGSE